MKRVQKRFIYRGIGSAMSDYLKVSDDTIRRDLIALEKAGKLVREHGGALSVDFNNPFQSKEVYNSFLCQLI